MHLFLGIVLTLALVPPALENEPPGKTISLAEAAKKINEKVTVEFEVKSTGGRSVCFLNSMENYRDEKNFLVFLPEDMVQKFKKNKIDDPQGYFKGKTIRVTGTVTLYREKPQIKVEDPAQIKVIAKK